MNIVFWWTVLLARTTCRTPLATLDGLHGSADAWTFWNGIITAIHRLHDWHTTVNGPVSITGRGLLPVCFVEGNADLRTHGAAPKDP